MFFFLLTVTWVFHLILPTKSSLSHVPWFLYSAFIWNLLAAASGVNLEGQGIFLIGTLPCIDTTRKTLIVPRIEPSLDTMATRS